MTQQICCKVNLMTSQEFKRWLGKQGCAFEPGHGGHLIVRLGNKMSILPMHGKSKELGLRGRTAASGWGVSWTTR